MTQDARRNKYAKNRNLWRRIYSQKRRKPNVQVFIDPALNVTFSYDLNKVTRHRDYFLIQSVGSQSFPLSLFAFYDEGLIAFNNTTLASSSFNFTFNNTPDAVVVTVDEVSDNSNNIIAFGTTFTSTSLTVGTSAPFSGNIRYRAVYSPGGYPALATSSLVPASGTFVVFANHITTSNVTTYSINYNVNGGAPNILYMTPWDFFGNFDNDVYIDKTTISTDNSNGNISAPINNPIYFIAVK